MESHRAHTFGRLLFAFALAALFTIGVRAETLSKVEVENEGRRVAIHMAGPEDAQQAILIAHDWFGVSELYGKLAERYARQGYRVGVVDLYDAPAATDHAGANKRMNAYFGRPAAERLSDLRAVLEHMGRSASRIGIVGFSLGGNVALDTSVAHPDLVDATVVIYGWGLEQRDDPELSKLDGPVLLMTGSNDGLATASNLEVVPRLIALRKSVEFHVLPDLRHAYLQPLFNGGANYDEAGTQLTLETIDRFLDKAL